MRKVGGVGLPTTGEACRPQRLSAWAQIGELDELELSRRLYRSAGGSTPKRAPARPLPDWARVREELARRDHQVTLALLWEEYKGEHPDGYQ
jgi:transposase